MNAINKKITSMATLLFSFMPIYATTENLNQSASKRISTTISHTTNIDQQEVEGIEATAQRWHLSVSDYVRYTEIINGPLGRWNPQIDPVLALGIYSDNEADLQHYATLYARQEYELTQRTQAFERAYHEAFNRLYPNTHLIDKNLLQPYYDHQQQKLGKQSIQSKQSVSTSFPSPRFKVGDRLLYFPNVKCQHCGQMIQSWRALLQSVKSSAIDIYVVDADNTDQVRHWASINAINPEWIKEGSVTLNVDGGLSKQLAGQVSGPTSSLYLSRNQSVFALNPQHLEL